MRISSFFVGALALTTCLSFPAFAVPEVTVHPSGTSPVFLSSLTAPGFVQKQEEMRQVPGAVALVPKSDFDKKYALTLKDMLSHAPGVFAQPRYGEEVRISIRGSGLSRANHLRGIMLLQDGVPLNLADNSGDFLEIDPLALQNVEVYKGANALRFGAGTLGGAVNAVSTTARNVDYNVLLRQEIGSYDTIRSHAEAAQRTDNADAFISVTGATSSGYREHSGYDDARIRGNVGVKLNDNAETRFFLSYNNVNQNVPGTLTRANALRHPKMAPLINHVNDYARDVRSVRLSNTAAIQLDEKNLLEVGAYATDKQLFHPIFRVLDQKSHDYGAFSRIKSKQKLGGFNHDLLLGLNWRAGTTRAKQFANVFGSRGALAVDTDQQSQNWELYGEDQWHLSPVFSLVGGAQYMHAARSLDNRLAPASSARKEYAQINPKIGAIWDVAPTAQIFTNLSRSSEVGTFSELVQAPVVGFVPLDVQKAWTFELGTRGNHADWDWDISAYRSELKDELLQFTTNASIPASTFNAGDTVHQGLELGAGYSLVRDWFASGDQLKFNQLYTFNDFRFQNDPQFGDNQLAGVPRHVLRSELRYKQPKWSAAPIVEWVPDAPYVDFANTLKANGYAVVNFEASREIMPNVELFFEGRNLLNKNYISNYSTITDASVAPTNVFYPGDGLSLFTGVQVKF